MEQVKSALTILSILILMVKKYETGRILVIIPTPSHSHQIAYHPLWATLSKRGHEVVVLTSDPIGDPSLTNLTEIDISSAYANMKALNFYEYRLKSIKWTEIQQKYIWNVSEALIEEILSNPQVKNLHAPNNKKGFDLVMSEILFATGFCMFAHRFNSPLIGLSSTGMFAVTHYLIGNPVLPSHASSWELEDRILADELSFWQRVLNFVELWTLVYGHINDFMVRQQRLFEKHLQMTLPWLGDVHNNMSAIFVNQQEAISFVRPNLPNIIPFGNFHVTRKVDPLPKNLQKFLDDSSQGFIYVSFGTNVRSETFTKELNQLLFDVFSTLPCNVVWKHTDDFPSKPNNLYIATWLSQTLVLGHSNIRLFVYQGGLQSTEESVYYGVPLVGIPMLADQISQVDKMVRIGVAKRLEITNITRYNFEQVIRDVLNDPRYQERMRQVRELTISKPYNTLDHLIWWTEFVMNHKGEPPIRCCSSTEPWYATYNVDIIAIISITMSVIFLLLVAVICRLIFHLFQYYYNGTLRKTKVH